MIFRKDVYKEYLKWWDYWNSKIPQKCVHTQCPPSTPEDGNLESKAYWNQARRQLINARELKGTRKQQESLAVTLHDDSTTIDLTRRWIGGWED